ncbi:MAG: UvrD-helicase domain-containing protein [Phocaeicola plebeius]|nr:UvrD-helicase domain-containing protein [Phocaeicola plebeius]
MANYLDELNDHQRAAVVYTDGPSLVVAGAGAGKTRVLTYKIAYLMENGYMPWSILALTFTNKAAREMKERIARQVGEERARYLWMGTFHSIFSRILRAEAELVGFSSSFTVYDASDSRNLLKTLIKEMRLDEKVYKPAAVQSRISNAKNRLLLPDAYRADSCLCEADAEAKMPVIGEIYRRYQERLRQSGVMDFDDLLMYTWLLFQRHPEVCARYADRFQYVLVDEYQDTNYAQHCIVQQLTGQHRRLCVVGDDAQSIYSFRGANIDNILQFTRLYPEARLFKLEQNYRSTQTIVKAANSLIAKNHDQIRKEVFSENALGEPLTLTEAYSDVEEGEIVANQIQRLHMHDGYTYNDMAILYRTNVQSRIFEEALRKRSIPYRIYGGLSFYQRKEIKDVIAYFRLAVNPHDEEAFKRVLNYPARGIGDTTLAKLQQAAAEHHVSMWTVISDPLAYGLNLQKGTHARLQGFRTLIAGFMEGVTTKDASVIGMEIIRQSGIANELCQDRSPENLSRQENVEELVNAMNDFCLTRREEGHAHVALTDYLSEVALLTDQDGSEKADSPQLTLMTIHSAKGLEFRNVFVVGLEENLFPSPMAGASLRAVEEERRLLYVAITRAEDHCFLSYAKSRFKYGKQEFSHPSRFLQDIDSRFLKLPQKDRLERNVAEGVERFRREMQDRLSRPMEREDRYGSRRDEGASMFDGGPVPEVSRPFVKPASPRNLRRIPAADAAATAAPAASVACAGTAKGLKVGALIRHERFGVGEVTHLEGQGDNTKATVAFRNAGTKQLLLKYARFTVME